MYPVFTDDAGKFYLCPGCGTVREEDLDDQGEIAEVRYHELDGDTLSENIVDKALTTLSQLATQKTGRKAIERIKAASVAVQQHPYQYQVARGGDEEGTSKAEASVEA